MKHLFSIATEYLQQSDWKYLEMIKLGLFVVVVVVVLIVQT